MRNTKWLFLQCGLCNEQCQAPKWNTYFLNIVTFCRAVFFLQDIFCSFQIVSNDDQGVSRYVCEYVCLQYVQYVPVSLQSSWFGASTSAVGGSIGTKEAPRLYYSVLVVPYTVCSKHTAFFFHVFFFLFFQALWNLVEQCTVTKCQEITVEIFAF